MASSGGRADSGDCECGGRSTTNTSLQHDMRYCEVFVSRVGMSVCALSCVSAVVSRPRQSSGLESSEERTQARSQVSAYRGPRTMTTPPTALICTLSKNKRAHNLTTILYVLRPAPASAPAARDPTRRRPPSRATCPGPPPCRARPSSCRRSRWCRAAGPPGRRLPGR